MTENPLLIAAGCIALAVINRYRGDGFGTADKLQPRAPAAVLVGLVSLLFHAWPIALALGLGFWFWALAAWGRWFDLGRMPEGYNRVDKPHKPEERFIEAISWNDHSAMFVREWVLGFLPLCIVLAVLTEHYVLIPLSPALATASVLVRDLTYHIVQDVLKIPYTTEDNVVGNHIMWAEFAIGGLVWGPFMTAIVPYG